MPNWCECDLTVEGPASKVEEFLGFAGGQHVVLDFNLLLPQPEPFRELDREATELDAEHAVESARRPSAQHSQSGYEWRIANWGTKWNASNPEYNAEEDYSWAQDGVAFRSVEIKFSTAWSPPKPVVQRAAKLFPELTFELCYFECGSSFHGLFMCANGMVLADLKGHYFGNRGG